MSHKARRRSSWKKFNNLKPWKHRSITGLFGKRKYWFMTDQEWYFHNINKIERNKRIEVRL